MTLVVRPLPNPLPQAGEGKIVCRTHHSSLITHHSARGFALVAVLFLIVVVAALGAFAMRIGMGQQQTVNYALLGARALAAANSGIEWGAYQAFNGGTCALTPSVTTTSFNLTQAALTGFTVTVTCTSSTHTEDGGATSFFVYRINARAQAGTYGQPDYVSRQVFATFTSAP